MFRKFTAYGTSLALLLCCVCLVPRRVVADSRVTGAIWDPASLPASFASTLNVPMVHCAILLDRSQSRFPISKHLRHLETRQVLRRLTMETKCVQPNFNSFKVTRPSFFGGVPSYFEAFWYPHLYFYRKSKT